MESLIGVIRGTVLFSDEREISHLGSGSNMKDWYYALLLKACENSMNFV